MRKIIQKYYDSIYAVETINLTMRIPANNHVLQQVQERRSNSLKV